MDGNELHVPTVTFNLEALLDPGVGKLRPGGPYVAH